MNQRNLKGPPDPGDRGIEVVPPERLRRGIERDDHPYWGACYERAFAYTLVHSSVDGLALVHGTVRSLVPGHSERVSHAWVEHEAVSCQDGVTRSVVFDGVANRFYDTESYRHAMQAKEVARYAPFEAAALFAATITPGPWERSVPGGKGQP